MMKKHNFVVAAGIFMLAAMVIISSCRKEIYTDEDALAAMKEAIKYKNDLEKELMALQLTNQLQLEGLRSQLSIKEMRSADSLQRVGTKVDVTIQVQDVTGNSANMSGFSITTNQGGVAKTLTTDANGFVVFPDCISGTASFVVSKTGYARASGILILGDTWSELNTQQAVIVPVFPTDASTAKISGVLTAQLDLLTEAPEPVKGGILSINFKDVFEMIENPNSTLGTNIDNFGLAGLVYDGGFMQTVKTGADGKYQFLIPKTKQDITYKLSVSTIQKKQKLLFGDYPNKLDSMRVDSLPVYFGYQPDGDPHFDYITYYYNYGSTQYFPGVNVTIEAPTGGQAPTAVADIDWAHNDSTVVTWSFTKFAFGDGSDEFTSITQAPVFDFDPVPSKIKVITPTAGAVNIVNGKLVSLYMTNGGTFKEYGRFWGSLGNIAPTQNTNTRFKFFEQLAIEEPATYKTAIADASVVLDAGRVKVTFKMDDDGVTRPGKGYTAVPNVIFRLQTPNTADSVLTNANLKINLLTGGGLSIDPIILDDWYTSTTGFSVVAEPDFGTFRRNGVLKGGNDYVTVLPTTTFKVDLLNGFKIKDGGLGYTSAPKVRVENYAYKQGTSNVFARMTIAEATTTIDAQGRIIAVSDPVMTDNLVIDYWNDGSRNRWDYDMVSTYPEFISVPALVTGLTQARARAMVNEFGTITGILLYNETESQWLSSAYGSSFISGKGYVNIPKVKVIPVGKTSVTKPAILQAVVNNAGRINNIIIVDGGKGYDVTNNVNAMSWPPDLEEKIKTNGSSDFVYDIYMGSGYHGPASGIFN